MLLTLLALLDEGAILLRLLDEAGVLLLDEGAVLLPTLELPPSTPQGAGSAAQLVRPTQLCWFSQPQPDAVLTQIG